MAPIRKVLAGSAVSLLNRRRAADDDPGGPGITQARSRAAAASPRL